MRLLLPFGLTDCKAAASLECLVLEAMRATVSRRRRCLACMGVRDVRSGLAEGSSRGGGLCARRRPDEAAWDPFGPLVIQGTKNAPPLVRRAFRRQMVGDTRFELVTPTVSR